MMDRYKKVVNCTNCGDYAVIQGGKCISIKSGKICGGKMVYKTIDRYIPFDKWGSKECDLAINSIAEKIFLTQEQWNRIRLAIRMEVERESDGQNLITAQTTEHQLKNGKLPIPHVSGSTDDEDEIYYTECPNCGRSYDEIDSDFCICSKCGWNANEHKFNKKAKRNPSELDYLNGDADIMTGEWI